MSRGRRRWGVRPRSVASGAVVALVAGSLTVLAVRSDGETVHDADLHDGGVWVSSSVDGRFARVNKAAQQFDTSVAAATTQGAPLDVLQDGATVAGLALSTGQLTPIRTTTGQLDESQGVAVPAPADQTGNRVFDARTVDLRGGTVAVLDPTTGSVWGQRYTPDAGVTSVADLARSSKPLAVVGAVAALAVDVDGGIHVVSGVTGKVVSIPASGEAFGAPLTEQLDLRTKAVDITAVGDRWVVYDPVADWLYAAQGRQPTTVGFDPDPGVPAYAALQYPGPPADTVGIEGAAGLREVPLDGGAARVSVTGPDSPGETLLVTRPLRLGSCLHAAWAGAAATFYGVNCAEASPTGAATIDRARPATLRDGVALRTNRGLVVLNDLDAGEVWDLDSKPTKIDDWTSLVPPPRTTKDHDTKDKNLLDEAQLVQPPTAHDDEVFVRPGRTSKVFPLDNDTDPAGSILAIAPGDLSGPHVAGVQAAVSGDGQSVDLVVPDQPDQRVFTLTYRVNNGKSARRSAARITVTVVPPTENTPPHLRPGTARLADTAYPVVAGRRIPVQVAADWRDRESDPVVVRPASELTSVDGRGLLTVRAPLTRGPLSVPYAVTDGRESATGRVRLSVLGPDDPPVRTRTQVDVVRGVVGVPLPLEPLANDVAGADPAEPGAPLRLSRPVGSTGTLSVDTNLDTGVVTVLGSAPGSVELTYGAQAGGTVSSGRIRVDLVADPDPEAPPVAVPDTATLQGQAPTVVDPLANDLSPRAAVLVTRGADTDGADAWLRATVLQGRWVRVESLEPATGTARAGTVHYVVSDGDRSASGDIQVTQFPPDDTSVPVLQDDVATVRAEDTVTIDPLANDGMAGGVPLVLDPTSVHVLGGGAPTAFASGSVIRYVAPVTGVRTPQTVTIEYAAYPEGSREKARTARVAVTVLPLPSAAEPNRPPVARSVTASVTAGDPLTITVPTSGVDPDGDSVTLVGITGTDGDAVDLRRGRVVGIGTSTIRYEAYPLAAGTDVLRYLVQDRFGARSQGYVRIGVVQPGDPQPPVAEPDEVRAAPGKTVSVDVTANDHIARGVPVRLEWRDLNPPEVLAHVKVDEERTTVTTTVRATAGQHVTYGIDDGLFDPSRTTLTVVPVPGWVNPPTAVDDVATPKPGERATSVDALANDRDVDGDRSTLHLTDVLSAHGRVEGGKVVVDILDHPYVVPYVITDEDDATAMALIHVPSGAGRAPALKSGTVIEMDRDSTVTVPLADHVLSPRQRVVRIVADETLSASPTTGLTVASDGAERLVLTSTNGYVGPAAVLLQVTDATGADDADGETAYLSIPVQIGPKEPLLRCPPTYVTVYAGGRARTLDIPTLCHAWFPVGTSAADFTWDAELDPRPNGLGLDQQGTGGREVVLRADAEAPSSSDGRVTLSAHGSTERFPVGVLVVGNTPVPPLTPVGLGPNRPGSRPGTGPSVPPQLPLPRLRPFAVDGLAAGSSRTVDLAPFLDSPLAAPQCAVLSARVEAGSAAGLSVARSGCSVTVTAAAGASGRGAVLVEVQDAPGRSSTGRGTVSVLGVPSAPRQVSAEADRVSGGAARVDWLPPTSDGGSPITTYTVSWTGTDPGHTTCQASPCTVTGLTDGVRYTFTVSAHNGVGDGPDGTPFGPVVPDTLPSPVGGTHLVSRGDGRVTVGWSEPAPRGSAVTGYQLRVVDLTSGAVRSATTTAPTVQATVAGLANDDEQSVQVRARNGLGWGPFGAAARMQSAGTPPAVAAPTFAPRGPGPANDTEALKVSWTSVRPNGPTLTGYTVYRSRAGGAWTRVGQTAPDLRTLTDTVPYDGASYRYVVTATNGAGLTSPRTNTSTFVSVGVPATPARPTVTTPNFTYAADARVLLGATRGTGYTQAQWRTDAGRQASLACGCAPGAVRAFTAGSLGTTVQRIQVRVSNGTSWSQWSPWSATFHPYGPTLVPTGLTGSRSGNDVSWTWRLPTNGRPVTKVKVEGYVTQTWSSAVTSVSRNNLAPGTYRVRVQAYSVSDAGVGRWSAWTGYDTVTVPAPAAAVTGVRKGPLHSSICGDCYEVLWKAANTKAGSYTLGCYRNGGNRFYVGTVSVRADGTHSGDWCALSASSFTSVRVLLTGGPSAPVDSGYVPW